MRLSIHARRLIEAGYESPAEGLADLGLHRVELEATQACDLMRLGAPTLPRVYVGNEAGARTYRAHLYDEGVQASALSLNWRLGGSYAGEHVQWAANIVRAAGVIGATVVRLESPLSERDAPVPSPLMRAFADAVGEMLARTEGSNAAIALSHGLGLENWRAAIELLESLDSDRCGIALMPRDLCSGDAPISSTRDVIRALAPYVRHVECATGWGEPPTLETGDIDYAWVASILGGVGYSGALSIAADEEGTRADSPDALRRDVAHMKDILGEH